MISKSDIQSLFNDLLNEIQDMKIRKKVVKAWVIGCERGGWKSTEELEKMPFTLLTDTHGINFIQHTRAVTWGAYHLALAQMENYHELPYEIDFDRLFAGGLLHDVGKLLEAEKTGKNEYQKSQSGKCARHPISGAILASEVGLPEEIINTIACHSKEGDGRPQVIETVFIHQADFATFNPLVMKEKGLLI